MSSREIKVNARKKMVIITSYFAGETYGLDHPSRLRLG